MSNNIWYTRTTRNATAATRRMFAKMKRDGFPTINVRNWGDTRPSWMTPAEMREWAEEAIRECWSTDVRPSSAKAVIHMIARITQRTDMTSYRMEGNFATAQDTMLAMRIAAVESGMMTEEAVTEYLDINIPA